LEDRKMLTRFVAVLSIAIPASTLPLVLPTRALADGECKGFVNMHDPDLPRSKPGRQCHDRPDDFDCYEIKKAPHLSGTITLASRFVAPRAVNKRDLSPVRRLCAPAVKVTTADPDPAVPVAQHLVGYQIRNFGPFDPVKGVVVTVPQFPGPVTVDVAKPNLLLVPSDKNAESTGGVMEARNHFLCHTLDNVKGAVPPGVTVRDQFGTQQITFKSRRWRLCTAVNKDGGDPLAESTTGGLVCYVVGETDQNPARKLPVSWANQFESNDTRLDQLDDFCVTATFVAP
jgi:hypothetical protein